MKVIEFDACIIGSGGSGLRAALAMDGADVCVLTKLFPTRSHTVAAQGGINAALSNHSKDDWQYHMYDTVKGSDWLGDQDAIAYMTEKAPQAVIELEHMGMPFSRDENGNIYQRSFGGQTVNYGEKLARRTCAVADRTGHALLHTLYQQCVKNDIQFYNEWMACDLVMDEEGHCRGVTAYCIENGELIYIKAKKTCLATGGAGRVYASTTNAYSCTGDGLGLAARAGVPLQDMEMWQFHPTGLYGAGVLISEAVRGEGGYLVNSQGERYMKRYSPYADLACRDIVSRSSTLELLAGRGCGPKKDHMLLMLQEVPELEKKLPGIRELAKTYVNCDPLVDPIPVVPTQHYMMGGIPTNITGQVIAFDGKKDHLISGLYAVGECACVSIHGANRLGGNSLIDLVVFGRAVGKEMKKTLSDSAISKVSESSINHSLKRLKRWLDNDRGPTVSALRHRMQEIMSLCFGVFRDEEGMKKGLIELEKVACEITQARIDDKSKVFNTALVEAMELDNLALCALLTARSALKRKESRGAHSRSDYINRDDKNWLAHSIEYLDSSHFKRPINMKPLLCDPVPLAERS